MADCSVCCEKFNKTTHKEIVCSCNYKQCATCVETYLLGQTNTAHCMNCKKEWDIDFMNNALKKTFIYKRYKNHRENLLFERERSMFPETMPFIESETRVNEINQQKTELYDKHYEISIKRNNLIYSENDSFEERQSYYRKSADLKNELSTIENENAYLNNIIGLIRNKKTTEMRKFIRACPANECRGFLSTQWKCGLCNVWTCPECHESIGLNKAEANHVCLESNLKTAQLLDKDSRPCPKCASLIFRISGCPLMFCTHCHTGFNWNTGREQNGPIHNPHYFDYMRARENGELEEVPRNEIVEENQCLNQMPSIEKLNKLESKIYGINLPVPFNITEIVRSHNHVNAICLNELSPAHNIAQLNRDLRIQYLMNRLPEEQFKILLQQREKRENKKHDNLLVCQMFVQVCLDIVNRFVREAKTKEHHAMFVEEYNQLKEYVKNCLNKIGRNYNCVAYRIGF
jgi:ribosome assembly protein YihI (activator of Der GTPase)